MCKIIYNFFYDRKKIDLCNGFISFDEVWMNKIKKIIFSSIVLLIVFFGKASAQEFESGVVSGKTFTCNFLNPLEIFSTDITFKENGWMSFSSFEGNGFYLTITNFIAGTYWSLDAKIGAKSGDVFFIISGISFDPFIMGTGFLIVEYSEIYFTTFFGLREVK